MKSKIHEHPEKSFTPVRKTKLSLTLTLASTVIMAGLIVACNKSNSTGGNNSSTSPNTSTTQMQTQADDEAQVSTELNNAEDDVNNSLNGSAAFSGVSTTSESNGIETAGGGSSLILNLGICDANVTTDTANGLRQLVITYDGLNCRGNRTRTGKIIISIPIGTHWRDSGAVVTVDIDSLKITRVRDNKTITINGTYTFTNVTGGLLRDLATRGTITHTVTANDVTIQFADSATRTWSVAKQRQFTYNDGVVETTTGIHSDGTNSDVAVWGTNRYGNSFERLIVEPMVIAQSCDWQLTSGETETIRPAVTMSITYGLDSNGNPTGCPTAGNYYYYKAVWTIGNKTYTYIAPY